MIEKKDTHGSQKTHNYFKMLLSLSKKEEKKETPFYE